MNEQQKLGRLLEILIYLSSGIRRSVAELCERFDISERTVFRYIQTFRGAGFIIAKPADGLYQIDKNSPYFKEISELLHFSKEEAFILQQAIHSISNENLLKQKLVAKLYTLYDFDRVVDTIVKKELSETVHQLMRAIRNKRKVILKGYLSANSNEEKDRLVEPSSLRPITFRLGLTTPETVSAKRSKIRGLQRWSYSMPPGPTKATMPRSPWMFSGSAERNKSG